MKIKRELIYFVSVLIFAFLCLKFPQNGDKKSNIKTNQLPKEEMLSKETLKSIDSLNKSIDSLTIKNNTKIGPIIEVKIN